MSDSPGRNDPCPCGSGLKYKRCHLLQKEVQARVTATIHDRDRFFREEMLIFSEQVLGLEPISLPSDDQLEAFVQTVQNFHVEIAGRSIAEHFVEVVRDQLEPDESAWLEAQMASWLSIWEVEHVEPGSIALRDLLTGQTRTVREMKAAQQVTLRSNILARVVDFEGASYLCGTHPAPLPPFLGHEALTLIRRRLRVKRHSSPARLRRSNTALALFDIWEEVLGAVAAAYEEGPNLVTPEGDSILGVTDHYAIRSGAVRTDVAGRIRRMEGVQEISEVLFILLRGDSILANIDIQPRQVRVEAFSVARADAVRASIEEACGGLIEFHSRSLVDPRSEKVQEEAVVKRSPSISGDELALALAYKEHYYANWVDEPVPMLGDITPREAARTEEGRERLDLLLRDFEYREQLNRPEERFDVGILRRELRLD